MAGGETPPDLFPQQRGELVAHDPVQDPSGLLGVHQVLVNVPVGGDGLIDHPLGNLVEGHPPGLVAGEAQQLPQVPADGLPLTVRVGGQIHIFTALGRFLQVVDDVFFALDGAVVGFKVVLEVHAESTLGQVPQVTHAGLHLVIRPQVLANGFGLGRGLHDHEICFCHGILLGTAGPRRLFCCRKVSLVPPDPAVKRSAGRYECHSCPVTVTAKEKRLPLLCSTTPSSSSMVSADSTRRAGISVSSIMSSTCSVRSPRASTILT